MKNLKENPKIGSFPKKVTRRDFLKLAGVTAWSAALSSCTPGKDGPFNFLENIDQVTQEPLKSVEAHGPEVWAALKDTGLWNKSPFNNMDAVHGSINSLITMPNGKAEYKDGMVKIYSNEVNSRSFFANVTWIHLPDGRMARRISVNPFHILPSTKDVADYYRILNGTANDGLSEDQRKVYALVKDIQKSLNTQNGRRLMQMFLYQEESENSSLENMIWETRMLPSSLDMQSYTDYLLSEGVIDFKMPDDLTGNEAKEILFLVEKDIMNALFVNAETTTEAEAWIIIDQFISKAETNPGSGKFIKDKIFMFFILAKNYFSRISERFHHSFLDQLEDMLFNPSSDHNREYQQVIAREVGASSGLFMLEPDIDIADAKEAFFKKNFEKIPEKPKRVIITERRDKNSKLQTKIILIYEDGSYNVGIHDKPKEELSDQWTDAINIQQLIEDENLPRVMISNLSEEGTTAYELPVDVIQWYLVQNNFLGGFDDGKDIKLRVVAGIPYKKNGDDKILILSKLLVDAFDHHRDVELGGLAHPNVTGLIKEARLAGEEHFQVPSLLSYLKLIERVFSGATRTEIANAEHPAWLSFLPQSKFLREKIGEEFMDVFSKRKNVPNRARVFHALGDIPVHQLDIDAGFIATNENTSIALSEVNEEDGSPVLLKHGDYVFMKPSILIVDSKKYVVIAQKDGDSEGYLKELWKDLTARKGSFLVVKHEDYINKSIIINPNNAFVEGLKDIASILSIFIAVSPLLAPVDDVLFGGAFSWYRTLKKLKFPDKVVAVGANIDLFYLRTHRDIKREVAELFADISINKLIGNVITEESMELIFKAFGLNSLRGQ